MFWDWEVVKDWKKRTAKYDEKQKQFYEKMIVRINEMKGVLASKSGWSVLYENANEQIVVE